MKSWATPIAVAVGLNPLTWVRNTRRMRKDVAAFLHDAPFSKQGEPRVLAVITPWAGTWVPWYTLALALLMAARGCRLSFVVDDFKFGEKPLRFAFVLRCLQSVVDLLKGRFEVSLLSAMGRGAQAPHAAPSQLVQDLARMNTTWQLRGEMIQTGRQAYIAQCIREIGSAEPHIARTIESGKHDVLLIPGGVFGTSGLWVAHARAHNLRICSFDAGGDDVAMFASGGVACHLQDIPHAFRMLRAQGTAAERTFAVESAQAEMTKRRQGVDAFASQVVGAGEGDARHDGAVLIALNSSWDAAALGLHTVFRDNCEWIVETVCLVLKHTTNNVIVRQHPAERLPIGATTDDYRALLQQHFGDEPRLHFIAAADSINSYALLARVNVVVTYTSTIGIEAAALGKPVVSPSRAYYTDLGFVWKASDLLSYQALLIQGAAGQLVVTEPMRADAHLCYYLTQCCNWFFSSFNPSRFSIWSEIGLRRLQADPMVQRAITSLTEAIPLAYLNHRQRLLEAGLAGQESLAVS